MNAVEYYEQNYRNSQGADIQYPYDHTIRIRQRFFDAPGKLLDFGCGTGAQMEYFFKQGFNVMGLDSSKTAVKKCNMRFGWDVAYRHDFTKNQVLGYPQGTFDYIFCNQVLYFITPLTNILKLGQEFLRILKPGGKLALTTLSHYDDWIAKYGTSAGNGEYRVKIDEGRESGREFNVIPMKGQEQAREWFQGFNVVDVGRYSYYMLDVRLRQNWIILAQKPL